MYKIDRGVKIPPRARGRRALSPGAKTFMALEIGDSFTIDADDWKRAQSIRGSVYVQSKRVGRGCISRLLVEDGKKVLRIWRIK